MSALAALISLDAALLAAGTVALYPGAEALVEGTSWLAIGLGLWAAIVGVIIIAFTTTTPELFVAVLSGLGYSSDLRLGAIVGSNIANIGFVLGISAPIEPIGVSTVTLRRHVSLTIVAMVALVVFGMDGNLSVVDGGVLLLVLVAFTGYLLYRARSATADAIGVDEIDIEGEDEVSAQFKDAAYLVLGLLLLFVGSDWLIQGGQGLLESFGFSPRFIGLTVLAFGTPLPELATSAISVVRGESEFSTGNAAGFDIYDVVAVLGILAIMAPMDVPPSIISLSFPALLVLTFGVTVLVLRNRDVPRLDGSILVAGYLASFWLIFP